ncbi:MAG: poly(R)-hydroxyalkanoic acid synthase subunit PhaE [Gammaproteobacteria bacterium]
MNQTNDPAAAWLKGQQEFANRWTQWSRATDQYGAISRALWDLFASAAGAADPSAKARAFSDGLSKLQQDMQASWLANLNGGPFGFMPFTPWNGPTPPANAAPWFEAWQRGMTSFEWPALGLTRERQEAMQRLAKLSMQYWQAQMRLTTHWGEVVRDALAILGERMGAKLAAGERFTSPKPLYDLWIESAEAAFAKTAHSPGYARTQGALTNALSELRTEQRNLIESFSKELDLPTRAEVNSVHRRLKELKAELRAMQAALEKQARAAARPPADDKRARATRSN